MTRDSREGVGPDGTIVTGVGAVAIGAPYEAVLATSAEEVTARLGDALHGLYVYGSVATGQARPPRSDLDLYAVTRWPAAGACREAADALSAAFVDTVREVAIASTTRDAVMAAGPAGEAERVSCATTAPTSPVRTCGRACPTAAPRCPWHAASTATSVR